MMLNTRYTPQGKRRRKGLRGAQKAALAVAAVLSLAFSFTALRYMTVWDVQAASLPKESAAQTPTVQPVFTPAAKPTIKPQATQTATEPTAVATATPVPAPTLTEDAEAGQWAYTCEDFTLSITRRQPLEGVVATVAILDAKANNVVTSAFASGQYGRNLRERTSDIAGDCGALFAINGDYCGYRGDGIIVRGGEVHRNVPARDMLCVFDDNHIEILAEKDADVDALLARGLRDTYSFGPSLLVDGAVPEHISTDVPGDNPRTVVGQKPSGELVFVVVDGRQTGYSRGMDIHELAQYMYDLGCTSAYNLDGGMTSCMVFNGHVISSPCGTGGRERTVSDILCIYPKAE